MFAIPGDTIILLVTGKITTTWPFRRWNKDQPTWRYPIWLFRWCSLTRPWDCPRGSEVEMSEHVRIITTIWASESESWIHFTLAYVFLDLFHKPTMFLLCIRIAKWHVGIGRLKSWLANTPAGPDLTKIQVQASRDIYYSFSIALRHSSPKRRAAFGLVARMMRGRLFSRHAVFLEMGEIAIWLDHALDTHFSVQVRMSCLD